MKLLITIDFPPENGGIQRYLYNIVKHTYLSSDRVIAGSAFVVRNHPDSLLCPVEYFSTPLSRFNKKFSLFPLFFKLLKWLKQNKNSSKNEHDKLIEAGNIYAALPPFVLSFVIPLRYAVYCYGKELLPLQNRGIRAYIFRKVLRKAEALHFLSTHTAQLLVKCGVSGNFIYDPPKIEIHSIHEKKRESFSEGHLNLLTVGRLVPHKGHKFLIEAVKQLPSNLRWQLTIAGSGPEYESLSTLIRLHNLVQRVTLKTDLTDTDLFREYTLADIFIFPSIDTISGTEGFGIVLLEAMAHNIPIIASRTGAIPEVLAEGACGLLVQPGNCAEIITSIIKLTSDENSRLKLIKSARKHLKDHYVWK